MDEPELNTARTQWQRLRELLDEGLALDAASRQGWLEKLAPSDAPLKERLQKLLNHADDDTSTSRFESLPSLPEDPAAEPMHELPPPIGPYRPIRLLGVGGMSSVWLAERTDVFTNRPVALKLPRATWRHVGLAERLAQEREILARLDHPHIARIYDAGVASDGQPYLALEYVDGQPIDLYCRDKGLNVKARVRLFLQVVDAVAHAHARLVVHRDLKPSNVMVTAEGYVRLLDFGIAKLVGDAQDGQPALTQDAARVMTPWYAAPEQVRGEAVSTATDTYALGVVLFELLTGTRPYRPTRDTAAALEEAILQHEPLRPSQALQDRSVARQLQGDLDTIVACAMRKTPGERYGTVAALGDDLRHWLANRPVLARPDSVHYRVAKFLRRNRLGLAVALIIVSSLSGGLAAALWQRERAVQEAAKATAIKDYLLGLFRANDIDQADGLRKRQQSVQQLLEEGAASLGQGLAGQPEVRDEVEQTVGQLLDDLALNDAAARLRKQRVQQLRERNADPLVQVIALRELAASLLAQGDLPATALQLNQARHLCDAHGIELDPACLSVQIESARLAFAERRLDLADQLARVAADHLKTVAPLSIERAAALDLLGMIRLEQNQVEDAYAMQHDAMALRRQVWGHGSARLAFAQANFGRNLWTLRRYAQAEEELRAAWQVARQALGTEHVSTARLELDLGRLTAYLSLRGDGLARIRHAAETLERQADLLTPGDLLEARTFLGNVLLVEGRVTESGPVLQSALALREDLPQSEWVDQTLDQSIARYLMDLGRFDEARHHLEDLRRRTIATYGATHPNVAERSLRIAQVWLAQGRIAEAERDLDQVLRQLSNQSGGFGSVKGRALLTRVALLLAQDRAKEAQSLIEAQLEAARTTPRANALRDVLFQVHDLAAQVAVALGHGDDAGEHFKTAVELMRFADPGHPYLAATRCRYALWLAAHRELAAAFEQLTLAEGSLRVNPGLGPQFLEPLRAAKARLKETPQTASPARHP